MVNRGPSKGCITCRQRRVKCDEAKPRCQQCHRLGRHCEGYGKKPPSVRFKDETIRFVARSSSPEGIKLETMTTTTTTSPVISTTTVSTTIAPRCRSGSPHSCTVHYYSPSPNQQDLALSFFLTYVADLGRGNQSSRGFIEIVRPALATERHDSALFTAVHAVATKVWAHLQFRVDTKPQQPAQLFTRALKRLQTAVSDTKEREQDGTVLAALTLQLHDTFCAVFDQNRPLGTHLDGAWALLSQRKGSPLRSKFHGRLLSHLLHTKVSMCIRERKAFDAEEIEWLERDVIPVLPSNPSSVLDVIGVSVANIQSAYAAEKGDVSRASQLEDWFQRVQTVEAQLDSWLQVVPAHWHMTRAHVGKDIESSVNAYEDTCDIYPNIQIASLWNVWRIYRLILVETKLQLGKDFPVDDGNTFSAQTTDSAQLLRVAQEIFDDICYSVPFYLGNRVSPTSLSGMGSPDCIYPSYHHLRSSHTEAFQLYEGSDSYLSEVDHGRHATIQGPWRIMNILAYLAGLLTDGQSLVASQALGIGQRNWILEQFLRSLHVQRLASPRISPQRKYSGDDVHGQGDAFEAPHAEHLASKVRDGLWIMNIL